MSSDLQSTKIKNDMDFEWMLCLANICYWLRDVPSLKIGTADGRPICRLSIGPICATPSIQRNCRLGHPQSFHPSNTDLFDGNLDTNGEYKRTPSR
jgi:hypothetical protein